LAGIRKAGVWACAMGLVSAISLLTLVGCSGSSNSGSQTRSDAFGTWVKTGVSSRGRFVSCPNSITIDGVLVDSCVHGELLQLNEDGTYSITYPPPRFINLTTESGTWTVNGSTLTLTRLQSGFDSNADGVIASGELTTLASVTDPNAVPENPRQSARFVLTFTNGTMELQAIPQETRDADGNVIVNGNGTVNATVADSTYIYEKP
jgi:hypothetical protein